MFWPVLGTVGVVHKEGVADDMMLLILFAVICMLCLVGSCMDDGDEADADLDAARPAGGHRAARKTRDPAWSQ